MLPAVLPYPVLHFVDVRSSNLNVRHVSKLGGPRPLWLGPVDYCVCRRQAYLDS
jgi:hypothetical protein